MADPEEIAEAFIFPSFRLIELHHRNRFTDGGLTVLWISLNDFNKHKHFWKKIICILLSFYLAIIFTYLDFLRLGYDPNGGFINPFKDVVVYDGPSSSCVTVIAALMKGN